LRSYKDRTFDIVYVIEALCYSTNKEVVFKEVRRVLKSNGYFIIFDGYRSSKKLSRDEEIACKLTEKSMAVQSFEIYKDVIQKAFKQHFVLDYEENLSKYVLPTMKRFEKLSKVYIKFPLISRLVTKILPMEFSANSIAGYFMPNLIEGKIAQYMVTVLKSS